MGVDIMYQWQINDFTYFSKSSRGLATINILGEPEVIKFETDGYTFLPIIKSNSGYINLNTIPSIDQ